MWGADPTISWAFKTLQTTSGTQDGITWETGKTGSASATICNSTKGMVLYGVTSGGGYFQTTSAIEGVITNITLVTTTQKYTPKYTVYGSTDGSNWTSIKGNIGAGAESIDTDDEYTYLKVANTTAATAQLGVTSITVTYTPSSGPNKPTVSLDPDGGNFTESVEVTITPSTGATAYYSTDATKKTSPSTTTWTAYNGSAKPTFTETTTIWVAAVKDDTWSDVVEKTFTKVTPVTSYDIDFETNDLSLYVNWDFTNIGIRSTIARHGGDYYGANVNSGGNGTATCSITTKSKIAAPGTLTFYISKESSNTTASSWKAEVSSDGSDWTEVKTFDAKSMSSGTWNECIADLSAYSDVYVRISYGSNSAIRTIDDILLTINDAPSCDNKATISAGDTENGSFDLSEDGELATCDAAVEVVVTPHPATHYEVNQVTASNGGSVSGPDVDGKYTVTYEQNYNNSSEINVTFKQKAQYTVTWNVSGDETIKTSVYKDEKPEFPKNPTSCDATSTTFIGWSTAPWEGKSANLDEKTVYTSADAMPAVSGAVKYYAVFAKVAGESGWIETAIEDLGASDVFVIVGNNNSTYAMTNDNGTGSAPAATAVTILDGKISGSPADNIKWNISGNSTDGYTFYPNGDSENWLYCTNTNNGVRVGTNDNKTFIVNDEYLYHSATSRYVGIYNSQDWRCYTLTKNNEFPNNIANQTFSFYKYSAGSALDYMTTCCTKYNVTIADGIANGSVSADLAKACEGTTVTLTFTPALNYHLESWSLNEADQNANENTFVMPTGNVEVNAVFAQDACTPLATPANAEAVTDYKSAILTWNEVANADKYTVYILTNEDVEVEHGDVTDEEYTVTATLAASTTYKYTIQAVSNTPATYCPSVSAQGTFSTEALPTAELTLMENGNSVDGGSHAITVPFALPTGVTHTCGKTFVGWTSKSGFADGDEELSSYYEMGTEFTFENTNPVTLYAVYADGGATEEKASVTIADYAAANSWGNGTQYNFVTLDENITATASSGTNTGKYYTTGNEWRFYQGESATITIATTVGELSSIKFTYNVDKTGILEDAENNVVETATAVAASGTSAVYHVANSGTATKGQVRFTAIEVKYLKPGTLSNYSITCAAAPEVDVDPEEVNATAAGVANGVIEVVYDNVNEASVTVALFNDAACTEAFDGGWLTASINGDKNIAYTIAENTTYVARTAYIKLTAPAAVSGPADAEVIIPVEQAGQATVFASLEDLVAADLASGTEVTVSFSNVLISKDIYQTSGGDRKGVYLNVTAANNDDIEIFYASSPYVPATWVKNGYLSATNLVATWTHYTSYNNDVWELIPVGDFSWENENIITYQEPKAVSSVVVSGEPTKKTYVDGEAFKPAGLTVTVNYTVGDPEVIDAAAADWAFTPAKLAIGNTSVEVVATYNNVPSAAFEVTGLTVNPIPNKTVAEFIAAEGTRCYLEGTVSNIANTTYGNFDLTDESGTIYVYGCLTSAGESGKFNTLGISAGDKIKVIAEEYLLYQKTGNPDKDEAVNVVFVSKISPVAITIADKTMEVGDEWTIEATTDPAAANISYSIKEGSDDCITLDLDDNKITATAEGEATIIASVEDGDGYLANSVEFTVTVYPAGSTKDIVILAQYRGEWLALKHNLTYQVVDYRFGKLYDVENPEDLVWTRSIAAGKATFKAGDKYIKGNNSTTLSVGEGETGAYQWTWKETENGNYYTTNTTGTIRTILYQGGTADKFSNYAISNAKTGVGPEESYSALPIYVDAEFNTTYTRPNVIANQLGTICLPNGGKMVGATPFEISHMDYDGSGNPYKIYFDEVEEMVAGRPYVFLPEGDNTDVKVYYTDTENAPAGDYKGLYGTYEDIYPLAQGYYIIYNNKYYNVNTDNVRILANRAYIKLSEVPDYDNTQSNPLGTKAPRRISIGNGAPAVATGMENVQGDNVQSTKVMIDGQLFILRGEKMYDATGRLVK